MREVAQRILQADPEILLRDALALAGLCVAILAALFLPVLA